MAADDVDDVGAGDDFLDEGIGNLTSGAHGQESSGGLDGEAPASGRSGRRSLTLAAA
jgi:hypothetical protein